MFGKRTLLAASALLAGAAPQVSAQTWQDAYTDARTGITYQAYHNQNFGGFVHGIALPTSPTNEFIGLIEGPIGGKWAGFSVGGSMNGPPLIIAWTNGNKIVTTIRTASNYAEPPPNSGPAGATLTPLYSSINATHFSLTFRCVKCNTWATGSLDLSGPFALGGFAQSQVTVPAPGDPNTSLPPHEPAQSNYGIDLPSARNAAYPQWIAKFSSTTTTSQSRTTTRSVTNPPVTTTTSSRTTTTSSAPTTTYTKTYDYVVVGSGAGGQIMADRLSEGGKNVLLIERGPPSTYQHGGRIQPPWVGGQALTRFDIPGLCNEIWHNSSGIACTDIAGGVMAGCILGGGTAINSGLWWRPQPADYDLDWPVTWKYNDIIPFANKLFQRIPGTTTPSQDGQRYGQDLYSLMSNVLGQDGWTAVDANSQPTAKNRTFAHTPYMYSNGQRGGPLATYLVSAKARGNFQLAVNTAVVKLIRNGGTITQIVTQATGPGGLNAIINVPSTGRVILSAGVFNTAKILFRSAIGPADVLQIVASSDADGKTFPPQTQWIRLPVGYNLHDQDNTDVVFSHDSIKPYDFYGAYLDPIPADRDKYLNSRAGQLAEAAPNCNTVFFETFPSTDGRVRQAQWTARKEPSLGLNGTNMVTLSLYLTTGATSRGRLSILPSLDTYVLTDPYLKTQEDQDAKIKAIQSWINAAKKYPSITFQQPVAGQSAADYLKNYFGGHGSNHWIGTAKIGLDDGTKGGSAVVDINTQVYGTTNLFIVDASIFPGTVTANPSAFIMSIAERASDKILKLALGSLAGANNPSGSTTTTTSAVRTTTTSSKPPVTTTTSSKPVTTTSAASGGNCLAKYNQCGGIGYTGVTCCASGSTCQVLNPYYSQCL